MKAAIVLSTLALAMALCSAGGGHRRHGGIDYVEHLGREKVSYYGYRYSAVGKYGYRYRYNGHHGRFAAGSILLAKDEEKCGWKGIYDCDSNGCDEDPVCKAVLTPCGGHDSKCGGHEVCGYDECYEYECDGGYKCYEGKYEKCDDKCYTAYKEVCEDKRVYVCKRGRFGGRLGKGHGHGRRLSGDWGGSSDPDHFDGDSDPHGDSHGDDYDPDFHGRGFGHGAHGCGFIKKEVCKKVPYKVCKEVCDVEYGYHCTDEECGSDPEMVSCGDGYCRLGDECYQPECDKYCAYNKKHFCW